VINQRKRYRRPTDRHEREVVGKMAKALHVKNVEIAALQAEERELGSQVEQLRPKKRQKSS
jgi:hypothetical protein